MKIEFFNTFEGVIDQYPIEPMSKAIPKWVRTARDDYVKDKQYRRNHIFRCSGIADLYKTGYVVRAWHDILVEEVDGNMRWMVPSKEFDNAVQAHTDVAKFLPKRPWSQSTILKVNTPWHIISPVKVMVLPIPYADTFDFEACTGLLDTSISTEVNIQLYINAKRTMIEAGTPLCYLVPLTDKPTTISMREATEKDQKWLKKRYYINNSTFNLNIKRVKDAFNRHFNK